jgi:hypothetical protein
MSSKSSQTRQIGLRLSLGGAPNEPHTVAGLPGFYRPDRPTPVGGPDEATIEQAEEFASKRSSVVEIVELKPGEVAGLRAAAAHDHELARGNTTEREPGAEAPATVDKDPGAFAADDVLRAFEGLDADSVAAIQALEADGKARKTILDYQPAVGQEG